MGVLYAIRGAVAAVALLSASLHIVRAWNGKGDTEFEIMGWLALAVYCLK
jgi:hypothetical protein